MNASHPPVAAVLADDFRHYSDWRNTLRNATRELADWLAANGLADAESDRALDQASARLANDTLSLAFVAEFSRGKSELINALFFHDYPLRVLPSAAGRTTMCPTEIGWDAQRPPCLRLLPIATRATRGSLAECHAVPALWNEFALDLDSASAMQETLRHLTDTLDTDAESARSYGLYDPDDADAAAAFARDGFVRIPRWRHAQVNFPHPLLQQGLTLLDTPGLNALGSEPELTLSLLPAAHAVLFLLGADTGVTRSDLDIWREFSAATPGAANQRLIALNKIDGLWDELKTDAEIDAEIERQADDCARQLGVPRDRVFPVSAQKALVARIRDDTALLARSRLPALENALASELLPGKRALVGASTLAAVEDVVVKTTELLETRLAAAQDQQDELNEVRGRKHDAIAAMVARVLAEQQHFETGNAQYDALRRVFAAQARVIRSELNGASLDELITRTRNAMGSTLFSVGLVTAMQQFFAELNGRLQRASAQIYETRSMMRAMYRKFSDDYGLAAVSPPEHALDAQMQEMQRLECIFNDRFNTPLRLIALEKRKLTRQFFESLASKVASVFTQAGQETERWLRALLAPMDSQVREHREQLLRKLDGVRRIESASVALATRIAEIDAQLAVTTAQLDALARLNATVHDAGASD